MFGNFSTLCKKRLMALPIFLTSLIHLFPTHRKVFCFQWVEKRCSGKKWVNDASDHYNVLEKAHLIINRVNIIKYSKRLLAQTLGMGM